MWAEFVLHSRGRGTSSSSSATWTRQDTYKSTNWEGEGVVNHKWSLFERNYWIFSYKKSYWYLKSPSRFFLYLETKLAHIKFNLASAGLRLSILGLHQDRSQGPGVLKETMLAVLECKIKMRYYLKYIFWKVCRTLVATVFLSLRLTSTRLG